MSTQNSHWIQWDPGKWRQHYNLKLSPGHTTRPSLPHWKTNWKLSRSQPSLPVFSLCQAQNWDSPLSAGIRTWAEAVPFNEAEKSWTWDYPPVWTGASQLVLLPALHHYLIWSQFKLKCSSSYFHSGQSRRREPGEKNCRSAQREPCQGCGEGCILSSCWGWCCCCCCSGPITGGEEGVQSRDAVRRHVWSKGDKSTWHPGNA